MCGIVARVGTAPCQNTVVQGLKTLEYRGYDSAGIATLEDGVVRVTKAVGQLSALEAALADKKHDGTIGIGHTRWATHGPATFENAHPHVSTNQAVAVVHNGIIEQCDTLRTRLQASGHAFVSQTDSELIAHLFSDLLREHDNNLKAALGALQVQLQGAYAIVLMSSQFPETLAVVRRKSPLVIGIGDDCMQLASDQLAFGDEVTQVVFVPDNSCGVVRADSYELWDYSGAACTVRPARKVVVGQQVDKKEYQHFMLKEMHQQRAAITRSIEVYRTHPDMMGQLGLSEDQINSLQAVHIIAAGTSWHAGRIAQFFFESVLERKTFVHLASEFLYMPFFPQHDALYIFVSQSGETADTLESLRKVKAVGCATLALTNVATSSIVREAEGSLLMQAGPEIAVASTKAFSCQVASLYWLAHWLVYQLRGRHDTQSPRLWRTGYNACPPKLRSAKAGASRARSGMHKNEWVPDQVRHDEQKPYTLLDAEHDIFQAAQALETGLIEYEQELRITLAPRYAQFDRMIFLGRHICYPFAMEAALKLKEISYIFAQCYPAGELKHGPIALIDSKTPVVLFSVLDDVLYQKLVANAQEIKARDGYLIVFVFASQHELLALADTAFVLPRVAPLLAPLALTGVMQLFAYTITCALDLPVDKPRNLAKSVTVE